jgi:flagellar protein FliO/FliZ
MMKYVLALILTTGLSVNATEAVQTETIAAPVTAQAAVPAIEAGSEQTLLAPAPEAKAKLSENEIPLNLEAAKKTTEGGSSATKALVSMMIVGTLLAVSYFGIRRYKISNTINKSNTKIKVISQHYLGPKKSLAIIHVAGESILVGITDQNISMIKSLSLIDDEVPETLPNTFGQTLNQANAAGDVADSRAAQTTLQPGSGATSGKPMANAYELDEEFSFANVTETVSKKIKSMRSIS